MGKYKTELTKIIIFTFEGFLGTALSRVDVGTPNSFYYLRCNKSSANLRVDIRQLKNLIRLLAG